jgi:hypothetical protein
MLYVKKNIKKAVINLQLKARYDSVVTLIDSERAHWTFSLIELKERFKVFVLQFVAVLTLLEMQARDYNRVAQTHSTRVKIANEFTEYTKTIRRKTGN